MRIATSSLETMPRSPCTLSVGCRNIAGVPVDVMVAAIFRPMSPDFPTPATITRPLLAAMSSTALRERLAHARLRLVERVALEAHDAPSARR